MSAKAPSPTVVVILVGICILLIFSRAYVPERSKSNAHICHLRKVGIPSSGQLSKKGLATAHLPVGYEAIRLAKV